MEADAFLWQEALALSRFLSCQLPPFSSTIKINAAPGGIKWNKF
jgi:hypothetical protein